VSRRAAAYWGFNVSLKHERMGYTAYIVAEIGVRVVHCLCTCSLALKLSDTRSVPISKVDYN
jgi:hypothetical protein